MKKAFKPSLILHWLLNLVVGVGVLNAQQNTETLFSVPAIESLLAKIGNRNKMGDSYPLDEGKVLYKSDVQDLAVYYTSHDLINSKRALIGLKDQRLYVRVLCKTSLEKLLNQEIQYPFLMDPSSKEASAAYRSVEALVKKTKVRQN